MRVGRDPQPSAAVIDAQSVKTVEESASISGYDGHKRVKGRKRGTWAGPRRYAGAADLDLGHTREHTRQSRRLAPARRAQAARASPGEDLGGRGVHEREVGALVQAIRGMGAGDHRARPGDNGLRGATTPVGRGAGAPGSFAWLVRNRRLRIDYERKVQTSETLIEVAIIRLLLRRLAKSA